MIFCACDGSCLGFLVQPILPVFSWGDTGSLEGLSWCSPLTNTLWALFILAASFVETLSVMAQVGYYKSKGERHR